MQNKRSYDLIFGIGEACSCTQSLRDSKLQVFSYPFDWLFGSNFEGRVSILLSEFYRFIDKDDLRYTSYTPSIKCDAYTSTFNGITFNHDFLKSVEFDEMYELVKTKYKRRITRLLSQIKNAKSILIVYLETPSRIDKLADNNILKEQLHKIKMKYPHKTINILYFTNDESLNSMEYKEEFISNDIIKVMGNYKLYGVYNDIDNRGGGELDYVVIPEFFTQYLQNYSLNLSFNTKVKTTFFKIKCVIKSLSRRIKRLPTQILINLVPNKKARKELRKKYLK